MEQISISNWERIGKNPELDLDDDFFADITFFLLKKNACQGFEP
ncbi:hypothetical protein [Chryseobacterium arachidis]|nr:hypothetical protein [Chryseobacterium arachidis]